jgi:hypothetical protein
VETERSSGSYVGSLRQAGRKIEDGLPADGIVVEEKPKPDPGAVVRAFAFGSGEPVTAAAPDTGVVAAAADKQPKKALSEIPSDGRSANFVTKALFQS